MASEHSEQGAGSAVSTVSTEPVSLLPDWTAPVWLVKSQQREQRGQVPEFRTPVEMEEDEEEEEERSPSPEPESEPESEPETSAQAAPTPMAAGSGGVTEHRARVGSEEDGFFGVRAASPSAVALLTERFALMTDEVFWKGADVRKRKGSGAAEEVDRLADELRGGVALKGVKAPRTMRTQDSPGGIYAQESLCLTESVRALERVENCPEVENLGSTEVEKRVILHAKRSSLPKGPLRQVEIVEPFSPAKPLGESHSPY